MQIEKAFEMLQNTKEMINHLEYQREILVDEIKEHFQKTGTTEYSDGINTVKNITSNRINYDVERMKKFFGTKQFKKLTDRTITVDEAALRELFADDPTLKEKIIDVLEFHYSPSKTKIEKAFEDGLFSESDVEKFADISVSNYLKIVATKSNE